MNEIDVYSQPSYDDRIKLYHNTRDYKESRLLKFKFRDKPRDTDIVVHNIVNDLTMKKFGLPLRNLFFVYVSTFDKTARQMRAIPLGDNVRYFFNPEVDDMTFWFNDEIMENKLLEYVQGLVMGDSIATDEHTIIKIVDGALTASNNLKSMIDDLANRLYGYVENPTDFTRKVLKFIISKLKDYVNNIKEVDSVSKLPIPTNAEVMIYAPDDIYLMSTVTS